MNVFGKKVQYIIDWLKKIGFNNFETVQTVFKKPSEIQSLEPVEEGFGKGLFVIISAKNNKSRVTNGELQ